jgi:hypothetical protein
VALTYSFDTCTLLAPADDADAKGINRNENAKHIIANLYFKCGSISSEIISTP